jgi:hypothetical protein
LKADALPPGGSDYARIALDIDDRRFASHRDGFSDSRNLECEGDYSDTEPYELVALLTRVNKSAVVLQIAEAGSLRITNLQLRVLEKG